ncbi:pimeloyl-ACP methyl ester carboxylesterase [Natronobacillus azotifigens]|uniref:Alpha/beta hydrolase n=1 Tax=Natronobacillus azotifigens TaxID=472978 RepID=A0A9J6RB64_9BACI|nr:alpha/beta hydrolase [Natronobacillus azotifigens]MCZ0702920.1 alpha/beta hydrolase [Natronobacillus azotifigens]
MKVYNEFVGDDNGVFVRCLINHDKAPNVIFLMTPIGSVEYGVAIQNYQPLFDNGFNVFAVDLPGIGNSSNARFTYNNIKAAMKSVAEYIKENYSDSIHLYGGTGTGGIIGQALASDKDLPYFQSYSQLGVANHGNLAMIGNSTLLKLVFPIMKIAAKFFPKYRLKFKIPKYNGYNAEKENNWYRNMMKEYPGIFDFPLEVVYTLLWLLIAKDSPINEQPCSPTLVMAAKHDRYYETEYVNAYYQKLETDKKLIWLDDSHCVFVWRAPELAQLVMDWINSTESKENKDRNNADLFQSPANTQKDGGKEVLPFF